MHSVVELCISSQQLSIASVLVAPTQTENSFVFLHMPERVSLQREVTYLDISVEGELLGRLSKLLSMF